MIDVLAFRPCGECRAYVPLDGGCVHWPLKKSAEAVRAGRARRQRERRAAQNELLRQIRAARA